MSNRMKRWSRGVVFTIAMTGMCVPASASAQSVENTFDDLFSMTTSYAALTGALAAMAVMVPLGITTIVGSGAMNTKNASMEQYLRDNEAEVREALAMGQGVVVDDMARALELTPSERVALGKMLRKERAVFGELAEPARLTPERAGLFVEQLATFMAADPELSEALERVTQGG